MRKILTSFIILVMMILNFQIIAQADRELVGTTVVKDNMLFINGNPIPAAQLPNGFVYVGVEDLDNYGFDVYMNLYEEEKGNVKKIYTVKRNEKKVFELQYQ